MTATRITRLDARYGRTPTRRRRRRVQALAGAAILAAAVTAWAVWTGIGGSIGAMQVSTLGFVENGATSVSVAWEVDGRAGQTLLCAIEAQASDDVIVGLKEVRVPVTGSATRKHTTTVRTVRAADTGLIASCRGA